MATAIRNSRLGSPGFSGVSAEAAGFDCEGDGADASPADCDGVVGEVLRRFLRLRRDNARCSVLGRSLDQIHNQRMLIAEGRGYVDLILTIENLFEIIDFEEIAQPVAIGLAHRAPVDEVKNDASKIFGRANTPVP